MRVFITGATGHVGEAISDAFIRAGHQVEALVRSDTAADRVAERGLVPVRGNLQDLSFVASAQQCDVVVHAAFDYSGDSNGVDIDTHVVSALLQALDVEATSSGRRRQFIYTSNACLLRAVEGQPVSESVDVHHPDIPASWRFAVESRVLDAGASRENLDGELVTTVVRLGIVYGGCGGSGPSMYAAARARGAGVYLAPPDAVGASPVRLAFVERRDAASLYLLAAERQIPGMLHAVDGHLLHPADVAAAVSVAAGYDGRTIGLDASAAKDALGPHTTDIMSRDLAVLPLRSRSVGWNPRVASFVDGVQQAIREWEDNACSRDAG